MVTFAVGQASFFASSLVLRETGGLLAFSVEQRQALALLSIRIAGSTTYIVAPSYSSPVLLLPMALAGIPMMFWLLFRGIDPQE